MPIVSIIIPVYNTGKYLYKCIDSILNQTLQDVEIIIVDDGSEKETANICDDFAHKDSRVIVIHKMNEGVSVARNLGIVKARGEFIGFVDSDDWIESSMYEDLVEEIRSSCADVIMCDATTVWDNGKFELDTFACLSNSCTLLKSEITPERQLELAGSSWRALYRARQLKENHIEFPVGLKFSEDRIFNMIVLGTSRLFCYKKQSYYNRYMRAGSCVNTFHLDFVKITMKVNNAMIEVLRQYWDESYIALFEKRNLNSIGNFAVNIFLNSSLIYRQKKDILNQIFSNFLLKEKLQKYNDLNMQTKCLCTRKIYILYFFSIIVRLKKIIRK